LAVDAVAGDNQSGGAWKRERDGTATASSVGHRRSSNCLSASKARSIRHVEI
jgi:hypothetical protein